MLKQFRERFNGLFQKNTLPSITEDSSLQEIAIQYPHLYEFIERKYGVKLGAGDRNVSLCEFVAKYGLPPAQILFMEVQLSERIRGVQALPAREASELLKRNPEFRILDVREGWEVRICRLPGSEPLTPQLLDTILKEWPKSSGLLLYCHHGIRSMDAATFLVDRGFTNVFTLKGGIEAWSADVDPSLPRYDNAIC